MFPIAQTNVQLFNQVSSLGWSASQLQALNCAYELTVQLYAGYFQADGKPFVCHTVGVASILATLGLPPPVVAAGLLHNVYGNGDFGDGRFNQASGGRRRLVRAAVGAEIEDLIVRFRDHRVTPETIDGYTATADRLDDEVRTLLVMDLADYLERGAGLGVLYMAHPASASAMLTLREKLVTLARALDQPLLATALDAELSRLADQRNTEGWPFPSDRRRYLKLIVGKSCRRLLYPRLLARLRAAARTLGIALP